MNMSSDDLVGCPEAERACARHDNAPDCLIEILHDIHAECKHVPDAAIAVLAECLNLSRAEILGVLSFYHDFSRTPHSGRLIRICRGEACQAMGCAELFAEAGRLVARADGNKPKIKEVFCLGNCAHSPAIMIDDQPYGDITPKRLADLLQD